MTDPTTPAEGSAPPPPVPPYAAHLYPPAAPPAHGYATAQQPYPGAPPVWNAPPPRPPASAVLAGIALALAIVGALTAFVPFVGAFFAWLFVVPAVVMAIIALVRRMPGRGMAISSLVISGVGLVVALLWGVGAALFGSYVGGLSDPVTEDPYTEEYTNSPPSLGAEAATDGSSREDAVAFGTEITIVDDVDGEAVWSLTAGTPEDATAAATAAGDTAPLNGAYIAVPIELTNLTDDAIDLDLQYEYGLYTWLLTGDGGRAETTYLTFDERYPVQWDIGVVEPGETVRFYDVYDVGPAVATTGYLVIDLDAGPVFIGP